MRAVIAVVGSLNVDMIAYAPRVPGPGETIIGSSFAMGFGGKGANQAAMAARFGDPVAMVGALGEDVYAAMTEENLDAQGIDRRFVARVPGSSGVAPIWVEADGTNRIIVVPGANDLVDAEAAAAAVRAIEDLRVVIGQFEIPHLVTRSAFAAARGRGAISILNPAPAAAIDPGLLEVTDWLIPNEVEFGILAGLSTYDVRRDEPFLEFARRVRCRLAVTLGRHGAVIVRPDSGVERLPAAEVEAVDTTGAGDAFVGAFGYGLARGLDEVAAARLAIACASDSVTREGTQKSFPTPDRARQLLAEVSGSAG
jgi:ribokinase